MLSELSSSRLKARIRAAWSGAGNSVGGGKT